MNTKCPQCDSPYNVNESHVGRKFKCKTCGSALVVTPEGVALQHAAAPPAVPAASAFDFGAAAGEAVAPAEERRPAKAAGRSRRGREEAVAEDERYEETQDRAARSAERGGLGDFLAFRKMIVPVVIQVIFWFLVAIVLLGGLAFAAISIMSGRTEQMLMGIAGLVIGVPFYILLVRMYCEVLIVLFRMNDTLSDIKTVLERQQR